MPNYWQRSSSATATSSLLRDLGSLRIDAAVQATRLALRATTATTRCWAADLIGRTARRLAAALGSFRRAVPAGLALRAARRVLGRANPRSGALVNGAALVRTAPTWISDGACVADVVTPVVLVALALIVVSMVLQVPLGLLRREFLGFAVVPS